MVAARLVDALEQAAEALELIGTAEGTENLTAERGMARVCARAARSALEQYRRPYKAPGINPTGRLTG